MFTYYYGYNLVTLIFEIVVVSEEDQANYPEHGFTLIPPNPYGIVNTWNGTGWYEAATPAQIQAKIEENLYVKRQVLSNTDGYIVDWVEEGQEVPQAIIAERKSVRDDYNARILSIKPDYAFPDISNDSVYLVWHTHTVEVDSDGIHIPKLVGAGRIHLLIFNGLISQDVDFNSVTGVIPQSVVAGDKITVAFR